MCGLVTSRMSRSGTLEGVQSSGATRGLGFYPARIAMIGVCSLCA